ncbi:MULTISPECIES: site-specific integrase [unclassified Bradyrhizobium]|uniref:tyrosine-type recombinase/integrase n=1 Tax=unclassified Bradyrhizobium TaxID=2631580 RepID=UPI001BAD01EA|nr:MULTISPECIES: integrase arm-type DNA-binding domain-containing protein [unclassified Bradyrhizobium]MBR1204491.1 integrase family protein [Bradyrhizobium sp. AUGA SZCCT0124]MBR1309623.1 integrase family protein [Bradyrhizobium sp. AUGA SZCCT0051]MBR1339764.1 integrase family protein [Bradyrhizobium sp. AUGA SZCCT0105]MBR1354371.1 integrase family protein [Bradyrhizobium sp. AUGA SZCCT0045]
MKFTEANVRAFKAPAGKSDHIEFDESMPGFGLRVRSGGRKYYVAQYRIGTKSGRTTLGNASKVSLTDAKVHAKAVFDLVAQKINPATQRKKAVAKAAKTFDVYIDPFLEAFKSEWAPKYYNDNKRALNVHFKALHGMPLDDIQITDVALQLAEIRKTGTTTMNRARSALSKFFNWAIGEGHCTHNPVDKTNKAPEVQRDRELSASELQRLWTALASDVFSDDERDVLKLMVLTLQRESQIGGMRVSEINLAEKRVEFPKSRVKNKKGGKHIIPLAPLAYEIISSRKLDDRTMVFGRWDTGFANYTHMKEKLDEIVKFNEPWILHDLRRTGKTKMSEDLDVMGEVSESILNHSKKDMDRVYNNANYLRQKLAALTKWEEHVIKAVKAG